MFSREPIREKRMERLTSAIAPIYNLARLSSR